MGLDDKNLFNWGRTEEDMDDSSFYLGLHGSLTPYARSRRGSASESEATSRPRSRASSFGNTVMVDGFRIEAMTSLEQDQQQQQHLKQRPTFKIEDVDEVNNSGREKKKLEDEGYAGDREEEETLEIKKKRA